MSRFFQQVDDSKTDAIAYVTLYPIMGFDNVTDSAISQASSMLSAQIQKGRKIFLRYGSEMNGNWFSYGRQPEAFVNSWKRVVGRIKEATGYSSNLAVVWAPNGGNGYPWGGGTINFNLRRDSDT
jgi:beta-mannanase